MNSKRTIKTVLSLTNKKMPSNLRKTHKKYFSETSPGFTHRLKKMQREKSELKNYNPDSNSKLIVQKENDLFMVGFLKF